MSAPERLEIVQIPAGPLATNAFLVVERESGQALIIDAPPDSLALIAEQVTARGAQPIALVITHGHWDHIADTAAVRDRFDVPVLVHPLDQARLEQPSHDEIPRVTPDRLLAEGDIVEVGAVGFTVLHTPGHSPGQISLYTAEDGVLLGGDTLFPNGYGTVEIPGASKEQTVETIRRLAQLPDDTLVLPGHGDSTTIRMERRWMERVAESGRLL
jgi:glyoxylase-like metal-dependent hydrolase (beta-lactamase superfamily II)